jgi:ABC-type Na+ transport system ATPase subunit NatA
MTNTFIYYTSEAQKERWLDQILELTKTEHIGIVTSRLPIIGNLSVFENIILPASYHFNLSLKEGRKMIENDLKRLEMPHIIDTRPDFLTDFEKLMVKYLQVTYLQPKWIIIVSPRRMYAAEYEEKFKDFLRCETRDNSVIIDHINHRYLFQDLENYTELDFDLWLEINLQTSNSR